MLSLPTSAAFLLMAAYLASYNPPRTDVRMFAVGADENVNGKSKGRKKGGGMRKASSPTKVGLNLVFEKHKRAD